jgi:hypothetical protein
MYLFLAGLAVGIVISLVVVALLGQQELEKHKRRQISQAHRKLRRKK